MSARTRMRLRGGETPRRQHPGEHREGTRWDGGMWEGGCGGREVEGPLQARDGMRRGSIWS
eukprot:scaffold48702_cov52-Phaeocystis_antarctica.AAC.1